MICTDGKVAVTTVDTVASGNMNSVTSNAVNNVLKVSSGEGTNNDTYGVTGSLQWHRYGKIVVVKAIALKSTSIVQGGVLVTDMPKPIVSQEVVLYDTTNRATCIGIIRTSGFGNSTGWENNAIHYGTFTYFAE